MAGNPVPVDLINLALQCYKDKPVYSGFDNTFTSFGDEGACYEIEVDGGGIAPIQIGPQPLFTGAPGVSPWTQQINWMNQSIAAVAATRGYEWIGETLFVNNGNITDLGGIDGGAIPGAPTVEIAQAYADAGLSWRIFQITVCPGSPSPTAWRRTKGGTIYEGSALEQRELLITKPLPGPIREFEKCAYHDGKKAVNQFFLVEQPGRTLRLLDPLTNSNEMPRCLVPCGAAAQISPPTQPSTLFESTLACDEGNQIDTEADGTPIYQQFTAYWTFSNGAISGPFGTIEDPAGSQNLVDYEIQGRVVDCDSGEPLGVPAPACEELQYNGVLWRLKGAPTPGTKIEWWAPLQGTFPGGSNAAPHGNVSDIFANDGTTLNHVNGAPDVTYVDTVFSVVGTNTADFLGKVGAASTAQTSGTDQLKFSGYVILNSPARLRDSGTRTGERGGIWINRCCAGELELLEERTTDTAGTGTNRDVFTDTLVPVGIHYIEIATSDLSSWQNLTLQASFDDGTLYGPFNGYPSKPEYECVPTYRCADTGICVYKDGSPVIEDEFTRWCEPPACTAVAAASGSGVAGPTAEEIAAAIVACERDVTPRVQSWVNEGGDVVLTDGSGNPYPPGTFGSLQSVQDTGTGLVRWSLDGSSPLGADADEFVTTGPYHGFPLHNVDLSLVRLNGSSTNSDFSAAWEVYPVKS